MREQTYFIKHFGKDSPPPIKEISSLHKELLPNSPLVKLGPHFMQNFYYTVLPKDDQIFGAIAYVDNQPAGFVCLTEDSAGFMRKALRKQWFAVVWNVALSILESPARIKPVWEAWRIMVTREMPVSGAKEAEVLSIGVLPEYRQKDFVERTQIRITHDLMVTAQNILAERKVAVVRAVVDTDNAKAHSFYEYHGWVLDRTSVPGWQTASVEYVWRP